MYHTKMLSSKIRFKGTQGRSRQTLACARVRSRAFKGRERAAEAFKA